jgi:cytochrome c oxidase assembly protein subunit 11
MMNNPDLSNKNRRVALLAGAVFCGMIGLAYASVPLYRLFCQATGFGGTTQIATSAPDATATQDISIRFDANTSADLGWNFRPVQTTMIVKIGEPSMAHYKATNMAGETATGTAKFNVTPTSAGIYFNKIECFCFTKQTLTSGQTADFPVQFFVDPAILDDPDAKNIREITLSYSFYPTAPDQQANLKKN